MKRVALIILTLTFILTSCAGVPSNNSTQNNTPVQIDGAVNIVLDDEKITVDGAEISDDASLAVYKANDIVYYPTGKDFTFGEGTQADAHDENEALKHTVVHITKPGTYALSGGLSFGQIAVDLGKDAKENPDAKVTLVLNGVDINCTVAPAVIFYNVYECGSKDEETASMQVDTSQAGANVIIADGTVNNVNGSYVARIYKSYELSEDGTKVVDNKKLHKYDGALYSKMSMSVNGGEKGDGVLNITAENEGLDSELHLTINGGNINIISGNDGINTNEDNVSVTTLNGGNLNIVVTGTTGEGDGIDSNGWLVINGGTLSSAACAKSADAGIDSDKGIYINGGNVVATGNMLDRISGGSSTYAVFSFAQRQSGGKTYTLKTESGDVAARFTPANDFSYLIVSGYDIIPGTYTFWKDDVQLAASTGNAGNMGMPGGMGMGMPGSGKDPGRFPQGEKPETSEMTKMPEMPDFSEMRETPEIPERTQKPDMKERPKAEGMPPMDEKFEMLEDFDFENGEFPKWEMPEFENGERPQMQERPGRNNAGWGTNNNVSELNKEFVIAEGVNYFNSVSEVSTPEESEQ